MPLGDAATNLNTLRDGTSPRYFEDYLSHRWSEGCARGRRLFQEIKARGYTGSFSNLERRVAKWRNPKHKATLPVPTVPRAQPVDPATGRSISPIVAAALCIKPRGLLTANQAAKVDALKSDWPEFAVMRRLAMRFRGVLKSKSVNCLGVWMNDAQQSGFYAMQRFARVLQRGVSAVRNAITEPWSKWPNGRTESPKSSQTNDVWPGWARTSPSAHVAFVATGATVIEAEP
jgi:transposase